MNNRDLRNIRRQAEQGSMYVGAGSLLTNGELIEIINELLCRRDVANTNPDTKGESGESPEPLSAGGEVKPPVQ